MSQNNIKIYLIGYPKSGTTWLTKLLAHTFQIPVRQKKQDKAPVLEINERLNLKGNDSFIIKSHDLPKDFFELVDPQPEYIIYIYRDLRAAFVSAFFYFNIPKRYAYLFRLKSNNSLNFYQKCLRLGLFPFSRWYMATRLKKYLNNGVADGSLGLWNEHIHQWHQVAREKKGNCRFAFITYEKLLDDTTYHLRKLLNELNLEYISDETIAKAVKEESFARMKSRLTKHSNPTERSKLRAGVKDDWKNYLSAHNLQQIADAGLVETLSRYV